MGKLGDILAHPDELIPLVSNPEYDLASAWPLLDADWSLAPPQPSSIAADKDLHSNPGGHQATQ